MLALSSHSTDTECDLSGLCRVCASDEQPLTSIFDTSGVRQMLQIKIEVCLHLVVREGDMLPSTVCLPCVDRLEVSYDLVQRCIRGQHELQRRLATTKVHFEEIPIPMKNVESSPLQQNVIIESDSDSNSTAPLTFQPLEPVGLDTSNVRPPSPSTTSTTPERCRHNLSSSMEGECAMCGSLNVLAEAVERMRGFETPSTSSSASAITPSSESSSATTSAVATGSKRKLACEFCGKAFHHTGDLNKHRRCHTGERPYRCEECGKQFAHISNLLRHNKLHSGERPFSCASCQRSFSRSDKLVSHNCPARTRASSSTSQNRPQP